MSELKPYTPYSSCPAVEWRTSEAHSLANQANDFFQERSIGALHLAELIEGRKFSELGPAGGVYSPDNPETLKHFEDTYAEADRKFKLYESAAATMMPGRSKYEQ